MAHPGKALLCGALASMSVILSGCGANGGGGKVHGQCSINGVCPSTGRGTSKEGFTNSTGWTTKGEACCDICDGAEKVRCFDPKSCGHKTGKNDWDFAILDQIWLPQLCAALASGRDPTLTHAPGSQCKEGATRLGNLSLHGLWPNYVGGFPQCCQQVPLHGSELPTDVREQAEKEWNDPTFVAGDECSFCSMWAHETMKHGTCFAADMAGYFRAALGLLDQLRNQTVMANELLNKASNHPVRTEELTKIFAPRTIQVLCDPSSHQSGVGAFLELRTCWNRTSAFSPERPDVRDMYQIDCPSKAVGAVCPELITAASSHALGAAMWF